MSTLAVSMIVKDEPIDRIVMLIDYMRPLADDFVIVDTGSADIVENEPLYNKAGARVAHYAWNNDFAAARNETLKYISADWTLHLDGDELPSFELMKFIADVKDNDPPHPERLGWLIFTRNFWGGDWGIEVEAHWHCRLFRTAHGRYYKTLHEQVMLDGKPEGNTRGTMILPKAPKEAYLIHSKPREKIEVSAALYKSMEHGN